MSAGISDVDRRTRGFKASLMRLRAAFIKELIQLRRDRITFAMMIMIPLLQLTLFGYAINTSPRHLPTAVLVQDDSAFARSFLAAMRATDYFDISTSAASEEDLDRLILSGKVLFGVQIPAHFGRDLMRGERPALLVVADAADPTATGSAIAALQGLSAQVFSRELTGPAANLAPRPLPYELRVHQRYNPAGETRLNIVPGLMGLILTLTMLIFTALSVTREIERGTMESLLAMPIRPVEIMLGKIAPYLLVGGVQMTIILVAARLLFGIPVIGSLWLLVGLTLLFILANLSIGYTFSTIAQNQLQAMQMSFFFFLPNILLSGFMFPFKGMPGWAQAIGEILPLTHYLRIVRGIMLKGATFFDLQTDVLALAVFTMFAMGVAVARFRQTLD
ncbi:ABC transporter permease [Microvirga sp. 3-52]|jgi:ABC-2 type transport system permease protein|uniref:ABC transporter permease n=1 Tax=Microvirga sp. 3-52 TaxID=2792425 RepID=UPI001ACC2124|nr:ABC transporter permease [Microvirga sp. 3-52]MBS7452984.1 ABC transporter permease [Microvirga sp. 3-52]